MFVFKNISPTSLNPSGSRRTYLSAGGAVFDHLLGRMICRITSSEFSSVSYKIACICFSDLLKHGRAVDHGAPKFMYELDLSTTLI
jgi:hypothetical protein